MKKMLMGATALAMVGGASYAGGIDRSGQGVNILFEEGTVAQFGISFVDPTITGNDGGTPSGDIAESHSLPSLAFKTAIGENTDLAVIYDQPFGANVQYSSSYTLSTNPFSPGTTDFLQADAETHALTALLRQKVGNGFSIYGGLRVQSIGADVDVPRVGGYVSTTDTATDLGWVAGAAWEKPEIAARVSLTYNSSIKQNLSITETGLATGLDGSAPGTPYDVTSDVEVEAPQSINLDFQTGVAPNTLVFGTIRWVNWSDFDYSPAQYVANSGVPLVEYDDDTITYTLGVGHRFSDSFSGALSIGFEDRTGEPASNLGPTDGQFSIGVGGTYTRGDTKYSAGVRYVEIGDATTTSNARFENNYAWAFGFQITHTFN